MRYWIMDRDETPQGLPLQRLIKELRSMLGPTVREFSLTRAEGYGLQVREWDVILDEQESVLVDADFLEELSLGTEEWFYKLDAHCLDKSVRFGLHDSTALYLECAVEIGEKVVQKFQNTKVAE